ncbi:MAG: nuclear transport factor 2 family protein [Arthrobacter sp.]|nr:nuclear transport factor 2 family protein [Arthrobacter sp.]
MTSTPLVPAPVAAFVQAINDADTEAFVALFEENGFVNDWGTVYEGHDGIRRWSGTDAIGADARMRLLNAHTEQNTTTVRFDWRSGKFNGESTGVFVINGSRLASFTILPER